MRLKWTSEHSVLTNGNLWNELLPFLLWWFISSHSHFSTHLSGGLMIMVVVRYTSVAPLRCGLMWGRSWGEIRLCDGEVTAEAFVHCTVEDAPLPSPCLLLQPETTVPILSTFSIGSTSFWVAPCECIDFLLTCAHFCFIFIPNILLHLPHLLFWTLSHNSSGFPLWTTSSRNLVACHVWPSGAVVFSPFQGAAESFTLGLNNYGKWSNCDYLIFLCIFPQINVKLYHMKQYLLFL